MKYIMFEVEILIELSNMNNRYYYGVKLEEELLAFAELTKLEYIKYISDKNWIVLNSKTKLSEKELEARFLTKLKALYG